MPGHEIAELMAVDTGWRLAGTALFAHEGRPCRLEYVVECDAEWRTRCARIRGALGRTSVRLDLARNDQGHWSANGAAQPAVHGCMDVDLGFSPSTNLLPIRRSRLAIGSQARVRAAWVRFPELTLEELDQEYSRLSATRYRYESGGGTFARELIVNATGFVLEYPDFWRVEADTEG
jgi:hypothetical protein